VRTWIARVSIGLGILACLYALAWVWDGRMQRNLAAERERERAALGLEAVPSTNGTRASPRDESPRGSSILIGRPPGFALPANAADPALPATLPAQPGASAPDGANSQDTTSLGATSPSGKEAGTRRASAPNTPPPLEPPAAPVLKDTPWKVEAGQTLLSILRAHYGRADAALVSKIARLNGLQDPSQLAVGQVLVLPPLESVGP
jgi:hypothetical protein